MEEIAFCDQVRESRAGSLGPGSASGYALSVLAKPFLVKMFFGHATGSARYPTTGWDGGHGSGGGAWRAKKQGWNYFLRFCHKLLDCFCQHQLFLDS